MAEYKTNDGYWVASSHQTWLPGSYATQTAARLSYRLTPDNLHNLWQQKAFVENAEPDGSTRYNLTEADMLEALRAQRAAEVATRETA